METMADVRKRFQRNNLALLRTEMLCGMNNYILNEIGDEEITEVWLMGGIPDGSTMDDILEIAEDDTTWIWCVECFAKCCRMAGIIE